MIDDTKTLKHIRIYNWLREMIDRGRFPTEIEIAKKFGVNRMTVRQSMDMLVNEGIVIRKRGKGTFLLKKPDKVNYLLDNIISFEGIAKEHNFKSRYEVIHRSVEIASSEIASHAYHQHMRPLEVLIADPPVEIRRSPMLVEDREASLPVEPLRASAQEQRGICAYPSFLYQRKADGREYPIEVEHRGKPYAAIHI